jgi:spermidine synthase
MKNRRLQIGLLFLLSGCAALVYEVVWFQLLKLTIGSSALSIGITVATFMGGMCLGSYFFHRVVPDRWHPLLLYAVLESGIALFGVINLFAIPKIAEVYFSFAGYGAGGIAARSLIASLFLLPPTILMGATLPAIARWIESDNRGVASLGLFYSMNIFGAVSGTLLAGFWLLRLFDTYVATAFALLVNIAVAVIAWRLAHSGYEPRTRSEQLTGHRIVYWVLALSGFCALGAQVLWTRSMAVYFGATVYTFSIILAVFLTGLGIGSGLGARIIDRRPKLSAIRLLLILQALLIPAIWWAGFSISALIHEVFLFGVDPSSAVLEPNWLAKSADDVLRALITLLPATILWGASFPVGLAAVSDRSADPSRYAGHLYAANTLGAVFGAMIVTAIIIPTIGTQWGQSVVMAAALTSALLIAGRSAVMVVPLLVFVVFPQPVNDNMQLWGRLHAYWDTWEVQRLEEGINATAATSSRIENGVTLKNMHVSGKVVASDDPADMLVQRQLGHLPALLQREPKSALIIGFGAGVTAGTFTRYDSIERIVIVEIEPRVPLVSGEFFREENYDVLNDPRTELIIDDGRHYLATTDETFDIITTDPIHPWVKGAAALYTAEFYELAKSRLNPGGLAAQWIPFYETDEQSVKSQIYSFAQAFPHMSVWNGLAGDGGYNVTLLGQLKPLEVTMSQVNESFSRPKVRNSLSEVGLSSVPVMLELFAGVTEDFEWWLADAQLNRDRNLRLEYLAGRALNAQLADEIYRDMVSRTVSRELSFRSMFFSEPD